MRVGDVFRMFQQLVPWGKETNLGDNGKVCRVEAGGRTGQ